MNFVARPPALWRYNPRRDQAEARRLTLRQVAAARADLYAIHDELEFRQGAGRAATDVQLPPLVRPLMMFEGELPLALLAGLCRFNGLPSLRQLTGPQHEEGRDDH
jgi:hypothetical protein